LKQTNNTENYGTECEKPSYKKQSMNYAADICREEIISEMLLCCGEFSNPVYIRYSSRYKETNPKPISKYLHIHDYYELVMVIDGDQAMNIDNSIYMLNPGDIIVMRPGEPHYFTNIKPGESIILEIDISKEYLDSVYGGEGISKCFNSRKFCEKNIISPNSEQINSIMKSARKLISYLNSGKENQLLIYSHFIQYMYAVNDAFDQQSSDTIDKNIPDILYSATDYIRRNLTTVQNLNEISEYVGASVSYLCRIFKSYLKMSAHEYIISHRLEYAKALLTNSDMNVSQVCHKVGFKDYSGFIALFRKKVGMTPLSYKKNS